MGKVQSNKTQVMNFPRGRGVKASPTWDATEI